MGTSVKIQPVPIIAFFISDIHAVHPDPGGIQKGCGPGGRIVQPQVGQADIPAAQETHHHGTVNTSLIGKGFRISQDHAAARKRNIFLILSIEKASVHIRLIPVSVVMSVCSIFFNFSAGEQHRGLGNVQPDITFQIQRAADIDAVREDYAASAVLKAGVDSLLNGGCVICFPISCRSLFFHIINHISCGPLSL